MPAAQLDEQRHLDQRDTAALTTGTTYYWHVRATNAIGTTYSNGSSTAFWSFTTGTPPGAFSKSSPANGATSCRSPRP